MKPKRLPQKLFLKSFELVPRVAVDLLIEDARGRVLLAKRAISPFLNFWHLPGSFLFKKELLSACGDRVAKEELGVDIRTCKKDLIGVFDNLNSDPRGHIVDVVYRLKIESGLKFKPTRRTKEVKFFKKLPAKIGFNHKEILAKLGFSSE